MAQQASIHMAIHYHPRNHLVGGQLISQANFM
jgi:hypothetical protein